MSSMLLISGVRESQQTLSQPDNPPQEAVVGYQAPLRSQLVVENKGFQQCKRTVHRSTLSVGLTEALLCDWGKRLLAWCCEHIQG